MDVFKTIEESLSTVRGDTFSVHQGKLYKNPNPRKEISAEQELLIEPQVHSVKGGEAELRDTIHTTFFDQDDNGCIVLCNGATNGLSLAFQAVIASKECKDPLIHVLSPYWMYLQGVIEHSGARLHDISTLDNKRLRSENELFGLIEQSLTDDSSAIYLANPCNPVGNVFSSRFICQLTDLCATKGCYLVVDHAYHGYTFNSIDSLKLNREYCSSSIINIFTFSKIFGIPGLRLGFMHAAPPINSWVQERYRYTNYTPNSYSQSVCYHYLKNLTLLRERQSLFKENLTIYQSLMKEWGLLPEGGFFAFLPVREKKIIHSIQKKGIGVVDGHLFGPNYDCWMRFCFTSEPPDRLKRCLKLLCQLMEK